MKILRQDAMKSSRGNFLIRVVNDWDNLLSNISEVPSLECFKKRLEEY